MKSLIILLFVLLTIVIAFAWLSLEDPGFIVIGRGVWTVETSLSFFILVLILVGLLIYITVRLVQMIWHLPGRLLHNRTLQQQQKAHESLMGGLLALMQRQWQHAEQIFLKAISPSKFSALHYLGAAYAASRQQNSSQAIAYFQKARESLPNQKNVAIILFEASLHLQQQNLQTALKNVLQAQHIAPKHEAVLLLLVTLYVQLADWQSLLKLLPEVRKRKVLPPEQIQHLENRLHITLIQNTLTTDSVQATKIWNHFPKATRLRPPIIKAYVEHLITAGDAVTAEPLLREALKYQWDTALVTLYGELETNNTSQQISYGENWLKTHEKDAILLLTLGRLCLRNRLWGKAQQYLEENVKLAPHPSSYQLLGELADQAGEQSQANEYYQRGLQLAIEQLKIIS